MAPRPLAGGITLATAALRLVGPGVSPDRASRVTMEAVVSLGYPASAMGPQLRAYVERQLLADLAYYGVTTDGLSFDWSDPCQEGHVTEYLDGRLEDMSDVGVVDAAGAPLADGWIDFIHGATDAPLFVFWLYLRLRDGGTWRDVKTQPTIPRHVWARLPDRSKALCAAEGRYDARWARDPSVIAWSLGTRSPGEA